MGCSTKRILVCLGIVLISIAGISCASNNDPVVFMAGYKPQANLPFVAAYVAQEKGFFAEQDLEVEIRHSTGQHLQLLMSGDVDFTTAAATSVLKRRSNPELPVIALALLGQHSQQVYITLEDSNIDSIKEWEGKTFGYKISPPPDYLAMLQAAGVDRNRINEVNAGFDPRILTEGRVDILAAFNSNEPNIIRNMGFEVKVWDPGEFGISNMGLTYITREDMVDGFPDITRRFLKATMKGLEYTIQNPDEAIEIVLKYAPEADPDHQRYMLDTELKQAVSSVTDNHGMGFMTDEQWKNLYDQLIEFGAIPKPFDYQKAYTNQFLKEMYLGNKLEWP